jgi:hypothetical protein
MSSAFVLGGSLQRTSSGLSTPDPVECLLYWPASDFAPPCCQQPHHPSTYMTATYVESLWQAPGTTEYCPTVRPQ